MDTDDIELLLDDEPRTNPWSEDDLGYREFARRLAEAVLKLRAPNGYVVGLHGRWGSGKSTALNFAKAFLEKYREERAHGAENLTVVEFRPWIISGHDDLVSAFFKVLSDALADQAVRRQKSVKMWLKGIRPAADPIIKAVAEVGVAAVPGASLAVAATSAVTKRTVNDSIDKWLAEPSLQAAYDKLRAKLAAKKKPILVIIDDIDRLSGDEIRTVMQMVKSVGRLPHVVYLLSYDRDIVWAALRAQTGTDGGPAYAEKIVQLELDLPQPSKTALLKILSRDLGFILSRFGNNDRWSVMLMSGFHRWICVPRDVVRLANGVKFVWPPIEGEVDPRDVLCMEGLRLFDNAVFRWIRANRDFLFGHGRWQYTSKEDRSAHVKGLKDSLSPQDAPAITDVLGTLFPRLGQDLKGDGLNFGGDEPYHATVTRRGVGYEGAFDAYFALFPSPDTVSKATVDEALRHLDDSEWLTQAMREQLIATSTSGEPLIGDFLEQLSFAFKGPEHHPTQELLSALFAVGESIMGMERTNEFFALSPRAKLSFLIRDTLHELGPERAGRALFKAFEASDAPSLCADVYVDRGRELGVFPSESSQRECPITPEDFGRLGAPLLLLIESRAAKGTLADAPFYFDIARSWAYLSDEDTVRTWLSSIAARSPKALARIAFGLLSYSVGTDGTSYNFRNKPDASYYDPEALREAAERHAESAEIDDDERRRIVALRDGLQRITTSGNGTTRDD